MKLLIIGSNPNYYCGWSTMSDGIYNSFESKGFSVKRLSGCLPSIKPYPFFTLSSHLVFRLDHIIKDFLILLFYLLRHNISHVIVIPEPLSLPVFFASYIFSFKYFIYSAGTFSTLMAEKRGIISRLSLSKASCIFPMSKYTANKISPFVSSSLCVAYAGYDNLSFSPLQVPKVPYSIIFVGNMKPRKGFDVLLAALRDLSIPLNSKIELRLVGDFPQDRLYTLLKDFEDILTYTVFSNVSSSELNHLYNTSVVNVLPSVSSKYNYEGFGIIHSEAIAANCLTIGSADSGNSCAIQDGNGFLLDYSSKHEAVLHLSQLLDDLFQLPLSRQVPTGSPPLTWDCVTDIMSTKF